MRVLSEVVGTLFINKEAVHVQSGRSGSWTPVVERFASSLSSTMFAKETRGQSSVSIFISYFKFF